jgi:hypothetical protein
MQNRKEDRQKQTKMKNSMQNLRGNQPKNSKPRANK